MSPRLRGFFFGLPSGVKTREIPTGAENRNLLPLPNNRPMAAFRGRAHRHRCGSERGFVSPKHRAWNSHRKTPGYGAQPAREINFLCLEPLFFPVRLYI